MSDLTEHIAKSFPHTEDFIDCCGQTRTFIITVRALPYSFVVEAEEVTESLYGYRFSVVSESDPFIGQGKLRRKIRRAISRRFLVHRCGEVCIANGELEGTVSNDGLVVDGQLLSWEELKRELCVHEGFPIRIQLS
jgi:hypothetical protein